MREVVSKSGKLGKIVISFYIQVSELSIRFKELNTEQKRKVIKLPIPELFFHLLMLIITIHCLGLKQMTNYQYS